MLVLTRKQFEGLIITMPDGTEMKIVVVEVKNNKVRLGIDAPKEVNVLRDELA